MGTITILEWFRRVPGPPLEKSSSSVEIMLRRLRNIWDPCFISREQGEKGRVSRIVGREHMKDVREYIQPCYKAYVPEVISEMKG